MANPLTALRFNPARDITALALFGAAMVTWRWFQFARCLRVGDELARLSTAFDAVQATAEAPRVLFIGDSIAVGCGAARPEDSIAGLIAQEFPDVAIVNRARNGARTAEAIAQLSAEGDAKYDVILINVGGNDIFKRTPFDSLPAQIDSCWRKRGSARTA